MNNFWIVTELGQPVGTKKLWGLWEERGRKKAEHIPVSW